MKRRFIQSRDPPYDFVEVTEDYVSFREVRIVGDRHYDGLRASDGADISTRTKHREYMKQRGLTTVDDFTQTWAKAAEKRAEYFTGKGGGAVTKDDIGRAIHQLESRRNR
jgi:hypothetical protein